MQEEIMVRAGQAEGEPQVQRLLQHGLLAEECDLLPLQRCESSR